MKNLKKNTLTVVILIAAIILAIVALVWGGISIWKHFSTPSEEPGIGLEVMDEMDEEDDDLYFDFEEYDDESDKKEGKGNGKKEEPKKDDSKNDPEKEESGSDKDESKVDDGSFGRFF